MSVPERRAQWAQFLEEQARTEKEVADALLKARDGTGLYLVDLALTKALTCKTYLEQAAQQLRRKDA